MKAERSIGIEDPDVTSAQQSRPVCANCRPPAPLEFDYGTVVWYCERCGLALDEGEQKLARKRPWEPSAPRAVRILRGISAPDAAELAGNYWRTFLKRSSRHRASAENARSLSAP
jgi:ribosomal protein L37AE/L43A